MDIAQLSMDMAYMKTANAVNIAVMSKVFEMAEQSSIDFLEMIAEASLSLDPNLGANIDVFA